MWGYLHISLDSQRDTEQSLFVRIVVAAGIIISIILGIAVDMVLGGIVGGVIEYALMKMA